MDENKRLLSVDELSVLLGVSRKFVEKNTASRRIVGAIKVGGRWKYNKAIIEKRLLNSTQFLLEK